MDEDEIVERVAVDGFHASKHGAGGPVNMIALTADRYVALREAGVFKRRVDEVASWPLTGFTERLNSNEGTALGPFLYCVTLFTPDEETVTAGFRRESDRESFKAVVARAIGGAKGYA